MEEHGWTKYFNVDIMDAEGPDMELEIPDGLQIKKDFVGKHLANYDSMIVMSHFKGHAMGGFGGALKTIINRLCIFLRKIIYSWSGRSKGQHFWNRPSKICYINGRCSNKCS